MMGTRHLSLLEQKKMQWAKEREEMAGLCTPWGPAERVRPLRKRLAPNLPEDPNEDYLSRDDDGSAISVVPPLKEIHSNIQTSSDSRGRTPRGRSDPDSNSSSLPPVNQNIHIEDPRRISFYQRGGVPEKHEGYDSYIYLNDSSGLSKSTENFTMSESDPRVKRKPFLSGDRAPEMGSYEKISTERSPYSSSYQFGNSNLSLATDGDATWREWGMGRGNVDEMRPRWGDRGINTGHPWNSGGPTPVGRMCDNPGHAEQYPTPGWVERGLSRMSGDGRGRGSAESPRNDPGIRVIISDESGGAPRMRGSLGELQNVAYVPIGRTGNENYLQRNYDGYSSALPYVGEIPTMHSSAGMHQRHGGSVIEGARGERVIVVGRDVCNASDIVQSERPYGYNGCISAPSNKPPSHKFKKNDDITSSLPNLQCTNTHLRGQNVPVDPEVVVEREMRRLKAMELQKAIRQQLEEREQIRLQEKELRMKEERDIEERLRQQQEAERLKKEEEERKHREKEEMESKKAEIMREALEAAELDAQKQRKKRSVHKAEVKVMEAELSKGQNDYPGTIDTNEHINNYIVSSCCPVLTEGTPNAGTEPNEVPLDNIGSALPMNMKLEGNMAPGGRVTTDYRDIPYHSTTTPVAPFKITIPESSMLGSHCDVGGDGSDPRQGGVLIVGRDVYLLPYVNTDVLGPRHLGGSAYTLGSGGGIESIGNGILGSAEHCDFRRDWIGSTQRVRPSKDVGTQTEPSTQGPLLLLLRMAGPDDSHTGSEQRSSADDSSIPDNEFKDGKGKNLSEDAGTASGDCCFCQKTCSPSQPPCSKGSQDCQQKQPQQIDHRPKWGANRPTRRYTTQSEKDPHYTCRSTTQKRQSVGRSKREVPDTPTAEEGSEDPEQAVKHQVRTKSKVEPQTNATNPPSSSASTRNPTTKKKQSSKKRSEKSSETGESSQQTRQHASQSPLPVLVPPRTIAPKRVQVVKPSLSLDQELIGQTEFQNLESAASRAHLSYFPPTQFSPMQMFPDCKHLPPPVLSPLQKSSFSPTPFTQVPLAPIRLSPSPTPPVRICPTPMPYVRSPHSPMPSSRHTQTPLPTSPSPPHQLPLQSNRHCGSPPVPAVLSKMRREQAKSPPRQFSFISTAPDRERPSHPPPPQSRKESRSGTPSLKPQNTSAKSHSPRVENKNMVVVVTPTEEAARKSPVSKPPCLIKSPVMESNALLTTPRDENSVASPSNISCPSRSSARDNSNALMMVTSTEDISVGSPMPNPLLNSLSMVEIDENGSIVLVTPTDEISVGLDCRSNNSLSRVSQLSAEGIPDGFWEDLGSSARVSSSQAEASTAASIPEDGKNENKMTERASVGSTEQNDEKKKQAESNQHEINDNQLPKSPDTFNVQDKSEFYAKEINNGEKEPREGVEKTKFNTPSSMVRDDGTVDVDSGISHKNGETPCQTPRDEIGDQVMRTENQACSVSPRAVEDELEQKSHDSMKDTLNQGPEEVKSGQLHAEEQETVPPDHRERDKLGPNEDYVNLNPTTIPSAVETISVADKNEDTDPVNVVPKGELIIQDGANGSFSKENEATNELERNYSTTEEKMEVTGSAKPEEKKHTPRDAKDEKEIDASLRKPDSPEERKRNEEESSDKTKNNGHDKEDQNTSDNKDLNSEDIKEKK